MKRTVEIALLTNTVTLSGSTDFPNFYWCVPQSLDTYAITDVDFWVTTASTSGAPEFSLYNVTDSVTILSTNVTIDQNETTSYTAATPAVVASGTLAAGDFIRFDLENAGTGAKGAGVIIVVEK